MARVARAKKEIYICMYIYIQVLHRLDMHGTVKQTACEAEHASSDVFSLRL